MYLSYKLNDKSGFRGAISEKIEKFEPWFFMFFGVFHFHRIWGLLDRKSYADF